MLCQLFLASIYSRQKGSPKRYIVIMGAMSTCIQWFSAKVQNESPAMLNNKHYHKMSYSYQLTDVISRIEFFNSTIVVLLGLIWFIQSTRLAPFVYIWTARKPFTLHICLQSGENHRHGRVVCEIAAILSRPECVNKMFRKQENPTPTLVQRKNSVERAKVSRA